jgi:hypothetical protein
MNSLNLTDLIVSELASRRKKNPRYSQRAFARDVGISSAAMCQVLNSRRTLSPKNAIKFIESLGIPREMARGLDPRLSFKGEIPSVLQSDEFKLISDWYYLAILNLAKLPSNKAAPADVAARLGLEVGVAKDAIVRLKRLGYIRVKAGRLVRTAKRLETTTNIPSRAGRTYLAQNLDKAKAALEEIPIELREMSSITGVMSRQNIPAAKVLIREFRLAIDRLLSQGDPEAVYTLQVQLFPVSTLEKK